MRLELARISSGSESTLGSLHLVSDPAKPSLCFTLEDEFREVKVAGKTRIPDGVYHLKLRTYGGTHEKYLQRYGSDFHKGMIEVMDVPGFTDILFHTGNTDDHTAGCILVGYGLEHNRKGEGRLTRSGDAYVDIYPIIQRALTAGEDVTLQIFTLDVPKLKAA